MPLEVQQLKKVTWPLFFIKLFSANCAQVFKQYEKKSNHFRPFCGAHFWQKYVSIPISYLKR